MSIKGFSTQNGIERYDYNSLDNLPDFSVGSGENSIVLGSGTATGEGATVIGDGTATGDYSVAFGKDTMAGCMGYYIAAIDQANNHIYLHTCEDAVIPTWDDPSSFYDETFESGYQILNDSDTSTEDYTPNGNEFSVSADGYFHWAFAGNVTEISGNRITYASDTLNSSPKWLSNVDGGADPCTFFIPVQPDIGLTNIGLGAYAEGWETHAAGQHSHAEGYYSIVAGRYGHAEGDATRAGFAAHSEGNNTMAQGLQSHSEGHTTKAIGDTSHAEGLKTSAKGAITHAEGAHTTAIGYAAHAEGHTTIAEGAYAHAEGYKAHAKGAGSHAEGQETKATLTNAHAEGQGTEASNRNAHAEGLSTKASGEHSHAEGEGAQASGKASHAEGYNTIASGSRSHAEGSITTASGVRSHAEGYNTRASGENSHAEGYLTIASGNNAHAEGYNTNASGISAHVEGNGAQASGDYSHAEGECSTASGISAHSEGLDTYALGDYSHAEGCASRAEGIQSHAEGSSTASGSCSHAEGSDTAATGDAAHAEGSSTHASGTFSHAEGNTTQANGESSHAEGYLTVASAMYSHAEGQETQAIAAGSHAEGRSTIAQRGYSHAEGYGAVAGSPYQHVQGKFNIIDGDSAYSHIVGNGTKEDEYDEEGNLVKQNRSNAHTLDWKGNAWFAGDVRVGSANNKLATEYYVKTRRVVAGQKSGTTLGNGATAEGINTIANGNYSHAEGYYTTASGGASHAEGRDTVARGELAHAEGQKTVANEQASHAEGCGTVASSPSQHVQGNWNIEDAENKYAHIVGNGEPKTYENGKEVKDEEGNSIPVRSNIHTLDWKGNAWLKGDIYVGGTGQDNNAGMALTTIRQKLTPEQQAQVRKNIGAPALELEYIEGAISNNKFNNNFDTVGKISQETGADISASTLHRTTEYHELWHDFDGTVWLGVPAKTDASGQKVQVFFYDANKQFIASTYTVATDSIIVAQAKSYEVGTDSFKNIAQAKYYRVVKTIAWDVDIYISPIKPESADEIDYTYEIGQIPVYADSAAYSIRYTKQNLTEEQKAQARKNIGADTESIEEDVKNISEQIATHLVADDAHRDIRTEIANEVINRENAVATEKAERQVEIAVERARIDTFTALEEGSTTGDAELVDARVDCEGKTWSNTGGHIRGITKKIIDACCNKETVGSENYNLLKTSEVTYGYRLQDDSIELKASNTTNAVSDWIPVEYGKFYTLSMLVDGARITDHDNGVGRVMSRINVKKTDGTILYGQKDALTDGEHSHSTIEINSADIVAVQFGIYGGGNDISTEDKLKTYEPMFVEGATHEEAYNNALTLAYIDGDADVPVEVNYSLKHDETKADKVMVEEIADDVSKLKQNVANSVQIKGSQKYDGNYIPNERFIRSISNLRDEINSKDFEITIANNSGATIKNAAIVVGLHNTVGVNPENNNMPFQIYDDAFSNGTGFKFYDGDKELPYYIESESDCNYIIDRNIKTDQKTMAVFSNGKIAVYNANAGRMQISADNGVTWTNICTNITSRPYRILLPDSQDNLFVASKDGFRLYKYTSADGYMTGTQVIDMEADGTQIGSILAEDIQGNLYLGTYQTEWHCVIRKSTDHGDTWTVVFDTTESQHVHNIFVNKKVTPNEIFIGLDGSAGTSVKTYVSKDAGVTWTEIDVPYFNNDYAFRYAGENFYIGCGERNILGGSALYKTTDYTDPMAYYPLFDNGQGIRDVTNVIDGSDDVLIAGGCVDDYVHTQQLFLSEDRGETWKTVLMMPHFNATQSAGMGLRTFSRRGNEILSETSTGYSMRFVYGGGAKTLLAVVNVGDVPTTGKTITLKTGYVASIEKMEDVLTAYENIDGKVADICICDGYVVDVVSNKRVLTSDTEMCNYKTKIGQTSEYKYLNNHAFRLNGSVNLGKLSRLDFTKGFTVSMLFRKEKAYQDYLSDDKYHIVFQTGDTKLVLWHRSLCLISGETNIFARQLYVADAYLNSVNEDYVRVTAFVTDDDLPSAKIYTDNKNYGEGTCTSYPITENFSENNFIVGNSLTDEAYEDIPNISRIEIYNRVLSYGEILSLTNGCNLITDGSTYN